MGTLAWLPLSELAPWVPDDETGTFSRYLTRVVPDGTGAVVDGDDGRAVAICGLPLGQPVVRFAWLSGTPGPTMAALIHQLVPHMPQPMLAFPEAWSSEVAALGYTVGRDRLLAHRGPPPADPGDAIPLHPVEDRARVVPALQHLLPPTHLVERIPFRVLGLERDGAIVALLGTTVDDGRYTVIQQVHTDPERRRTGLGKALLSAAVAHLHQQGRTPLYVVADDNTASIALARSVGFEVAHTLGVVDG